MYALAYPVGYALLYQNHMTVHPILNWNLLFCILFYATTRTLAQNCTVVFRWSCLEIHIYYFWPVIVILKTMKFTTRGIDWRKGAFWYNVIVYTPITWLFQRSTLLSCIRDYWARALFENNAFWWAQIAWSHVTSILLKESIEWVEKEVLTSITH